MQRIPYCIPPPRNQHVGTAHLRGLVNSRREAVLGHERARRAALEVKFSHSLVEKWLVEACKRRSGLTRYIYIYIYIYMYIYIYIYIYI